MRRGILIPRISVSNSHTNPIPHHRDSSSPPASLTGEATVDEEKLREFLGKGEMPKTASLEAVEEKVDSKIQASDEILNVHGPSVRVESPEEEERRRVSPVKMEHHGVVGGDESEAGKGKGKEGE
ncbi:MAG: hypothetical protein Q9174_005370 [Haloplaca sp. 1 TL-2023]